MALTAAGRIAALLVLCAAATGFSAPDAASGKGPAAGCGDLSVVAIPGSHPPSLLLTAPSALSGQHLSDRWVTLRQQGRPVPVQSVRRLDAAGVDLAIVLDTAAARGDAVRRRARRVAVSLLEHLPATVRVMVVSAGGEAQILSSLSHDRVRAAAAIRTAPRAHGHAWWDGVVLAAANLPDRPDRFAQVVVVTTGPDDTSLRNPLAVRSLLERRPVLLGVTDAGTRSTGADWADRCPAEVAAVGDAAAAGALLAARVTDRHVLVAPTADLAAPMVVRVHSEQVDASVTVSAAPRPEPETSVRGTKFGRPPVDSAGGLSAPMVVTLLAMLLLAAGSAAVLVPAFRTGRLASRGFQGRTADDPWDGDEPPRAGGGRTTTAPGWEGAAEQPPDETSEWVSEDVLDEIEADATNLDDAGTVDDVRESSVELPPDDEPGTRAAEAEAPPSEEDLRAEAWLVRVSLLATLPLALGARGPLGLAGAADGALPWVLRTVAVLLGAAGTWWLWRSTSPPYPRWPWQRAPHGHRKAASADHVPSAGPHATAVAPFLLCLLPAIVIILVV
jgi:hypothetical protein